MITPVPVKLPWVMYINESYASMEAGDIATAKQSKAKMDAYFMGYTKDRFNIKTPS